MLDTYKIIGKSFAKLNLFFYILGTIDSGQFCNYHKIFSLMQSIDLADEIEFVFKLDNSAQDLFMVNSLQTKLINCQFPIDSNNLIAKACNLFNSNVKLKFEQNLLDSFKIDITINKKIPISAGLGGGSSNAAFTLNVLNFLLNELYNLNFNHSEMTQMALKLGCDVVFNLKGGLAYAQGVGEDICDVNNIFLNDYYFVLVKPKNININTLWAYKTYDDYLLENKTQIDSQLLQPDFYNSYLESHDYNQFFKLLANSFENCIFDVVPELADIYKVIDEVKPIVTRLTGSGSCIFAVCRNFDQASSIEKNLLSKFNSDFFDIIISKPHSTSYEFTMS